MEKKVVWEFITEIKFPQTGILHMHHILRILTGCHPLRTEKIRRGISFP